MAAAGLAATGPTWHALYIYMGLFSLLSVSSLSSFLENLVTVSLIYDQLHNKY